MFGGSEVFNPKAFEEAFVAHARLLGFVARQVEVEAHDGANYSLPATIYWEVLLDEEWYKRYNSEFLAAVEFVRYYSFEDAMRAAMEACGAGDQVDYTIRVPGSRLV